MVFIGRKFTADPVVPYCQSFSALKKFGCARAQLENLRSRSIFSRPCARAQTSWEPLNFAVRLKWRHSHCVFLLCLLKRHASEKKGGRALWEKGHSLFIGISHLKVSKYAEKFKLKVKFHSLGNMHLSYKLDQIMFGVPYCSMKVEKITFRISKGPKNGKKKNFLKILNVSTTK